MSKKIKLIAGSSVAAAAVLGIGAFALFTDNDTEGMNSKAGTVSVDLGDLGLENAGNINPGDNDEDIPDSYIPDPDDPLYDPENPDTPVPIVTTPHDLTFTVANNGTKSIRTRQTLIITCKQLVEVNSPTSAEPEMEEVTLDPSYLSLLIEEGTEIGSKEGLGKKVYVMSDESELTPEEYAALDEDSELTVVAIKYQLTPDIFDGVGESAEIEDVSTVKNEDDVAEKLYTYKLKMDKDTPNAYQGATVSIDVIIEAMQYRNTANSDWETMTTQTVSGVLTGITQDTVPNSAE